MAKTTFRERKTQLTGKLNLNLKKRLTKTLVWSVALYAAKHATMSDQSRYKDKKAVLSQGNRAMPQLFFSVLRSAVSPRKIL